MVSPSALAVFRLTTRSYLVGGSAGRSCDLAAWRIRVLQQITRLWISELAHPTLESSLTCGSVDSENIHYRLAAAQHCSAQGLHAKMGAGAHMTEEIG